MVDFKDIKDSAKKAAKTTKKAAEKGADVVHEEEEKSQERGEETPDFIAEVSGSLVGDAVGSGTNTGVNKGLAAIAQTIGSGGTSAGGAVVGGAGGAGAVGVTGAGVGAASGGGGVGAIGLVGGSVAPGAGNAVGGGGGAAGGAVGGGAGVGVGGAVSGAAGGATGGGALTGGVGTVATAGVAKFVEDSNVNAGRAAEFLDLDVEGKSEEIATHVVSKATLEEQFDVKAHEVGERALKGDIGGLTDDFKTKIDEKIQTGMEEDDSLTAQISGGVGDAVKEGLDEKFNDTPLDGVAQQGTQAIDMVNSVAEPLGKINVVDDVLGKTCTAVGLEPGELANSLMESEMTKGTIERFGVDPMQAMSDLQEGKLPKFSLKFSTAVDLASNVKPLFSLVEGATGIEVPGKDTVASLLDGLKPAEVMKATGLDADVGAMLTGEGMQHTSDDNIAFDVQKPLERVEAAVNADGIAGQVTGGAAHGATTQGVKNTVSETGVKDLKVGGKKGVSIDTEGTDDGVQVYTVVNEGIGVAADAVDVASVAGDVVNGDKSKLEKVGGIANVFAKGSSAAGKASEKAGDLLSDADGSDELGKNEKEAAQAVDNPELEGQGAEAKEAAAGNTEKSSTKEAGDHGMSDLLNEAKAAASGLNGVEEKDTKASSKGKPSVSLKQAAEGMKVAGDLKDAGKDDIKHSDAAISEDAAVKSKGQGAAPAA